MDDRPRPTITIDDRELRSRTARRLFELGCVLDSRRLSVGDFVLSSRCCVERKNDADFEESIMDGRLFSQAAELCSNYSAPLVAVVGSSFSRLNAKAVRGALASLAIDFRLPVFMLSSEEELADLIHSLALREQAGPSGPPRLQTARKEVPLPELQQLVVESLPAVGPVHAKTLLAALGSVRAVVNASHEELTSADGIGPLRAKRIRDVLDSPYRRA